MVLAMRCHNEWPDRQRSSFFSYPWRLSSRTGQPRGSLNAFRAVIIVGAVKPCPIRSSFSLEERRDTSLYASFPKGVVPIGKRDKVRS